jgi:2-hydroxy-3-keto-5-methylthiopentenyl-1-phosphate phosphatase
MSWAVLCDFDRTITNHDVTDTLLEAHALPEWRHIETLWEQGHIGSRTCMQQQIALVRASPAQMGALIDNVAIDPHFKTFAHFCKLENLPLVILSDGLDYVIERVLARHGIHHAQIIASHMAYRGGNQWELSSPYADSGCTSQQSTCKCAVARQFRAAHAERILYIGDGRSDYCVSMQEADAILAKDSLLTYCQQQQLPHQPFTDFAQAQAIAAQLIKQPVHKLPAFAEETLYA